MKYAYFSGRLRGFDQVHLVDTYGVSVHMWHLLIYASSVEPYMQVQNNFNPSLASVKKNISADLLLGIICELVTYCIYHLCKQYLTSLGKKLILIFSLVGACIGNKGETATHEQSCVRPLLRDTCFK